MTNLKIVAGYKPKIIGRVTELHAQYYSQEWNFGHFFEAKVATELSNFIQNYNPVKDCIWSVNVDEIIEGSISINENNEARELISNRERQLKGERSRIYNQRALELWSGSSGIGMMDYRWRSARRVLIDIIDGLGR